MSENNLIPPDPQPIRSDALKNRQLLLDTARRLFAEHSVEAVSMSTVAEAAGVGKGTLYRHFENKAALCEALLDEAQRDLQERTLAQMRTGGPAFDKLLWFVTEVVEFVDRYAELLCSSREDARLSPLAHPAHFWWRQTIRGLLLQAGARGDVDYLADALYVLLDARTLSFQRHTLGYPLSRIADGLRTLAERLVAPQTD